ncbi:MAG: M23 family metallopeptidase [Deltaproteobacteria bacterium]|nr:M23 family metallopeptidase [Deltaproteobacteria bacterium]
MKKAESDFTRLFFESNGIKFSSFRNWVFYPGMLFESQKKWWNEGKQRTKPHQGVDLCFYRTEVKKVDRIKPGMFVPSLFSGYVVSVVDDYLGKSLFVFSHPDLLWAYGHLDLDVDIKEGKELKEGQILGVISQNVKNGIFPHIHISIGRVIGKATQRLDWNLINEDAIIKLVDPMPYISSEYELMSSFRAEKNKK